jgi:DNA-binding XRE family transcriptional regulator
MRQLKGWVRPGYPSQRACYDTQSITHWTLWDRINWKLYALASGLTQAQLAEKLGVERNTVNRWEMGLLPIQTITALAIEHVRCLAKPKRDRKRS